MLSKFLYFLWRDKPRILGMNFRRNIGDQIISFCGFAVSYLVIKALGENCSSLSSSWIRTVSHLSIEIN